MEESLMMKMVNLARTPGFGQLSPEEQDRQFDALFQKDHGSSPAQSARILVVDDDKQQNEFCAGILRANGFKVVCAYDGLAGITAARTIIPDLILLNIMMPVMDGYTALRNLRADPKIKDIKVILTSAGDKKKILTKEVGADDFLELPFSTAGLLEKVNRVLPL